MNKNKKKIYTYINKIIKSHLKNVPKKGEKSLPSNVTLNEAKERSNSNTNDQNNSETIFFIAAAAAAYKLLNSLHQLIVNSVGWLSWVKLCWRSDEFGRVREESLEVISWLDTSEEEIDVGVKVVRIGRWTWRRGIRRRRRRC